MTEELEIAARQAEDAGREVYVQRHPDLDVIEWIEVDGVETYNDDYVDEVKDQYWLEDGYRVAENYWRD